MYNRTRIRSSQFVALSLLLPVILSAPLAAEDDLATTDWQELLSCFSQVDALVADGKTSEARALLENAREVWPDESSDLAAEYSRFLEKDSGLAQPRFGTLLFLVALRDARDPLEAAGLEQRILDTTTDGDDVWARVWFERGGRAFKAGALDSALTCFEKASLVRGDAVLAAPAKFNRAITLRDLKRYDEAIEVFEDLLTTDANNEEFYANDLMDMGYRNYHYRAVLNVSYSHEKMGRFREAYGSLERIESHPYLGWCALETFGEAVFVSGTADRLALAAGGSLSLYHFASRVAGAWYLWLAFLGCVIFVGWIIRKAPSVDLDASLLLVTPMVVVVSAAASEGYLTNALGLPSIEEWSYELPEIVMYWCAPLAAVAAAAFLRRSDVRWRRRLGGLFLAITSIPFLAIAFRIFRHVAPISIPVEYLQPLLFVCLFQPVVLVVSAWAVAFSLRRRRMNRISGSELKNTKFVD